MTDPTDITAAADRVRAFILDPRVRAVAEGRSDLVAARMTAIAEATTVSLSEFCDGMRRFREAVEEFEADRPKLDAPAAESGCSADKT